jgi:hypothetical protein
VSVKVDMTDRIMFPNYISVVTKPALQTSIVYQVVLFSIS